MYSPWNEVKMNVLDNLIFCTCNIIIKKHSQIFPLQFENLYLNQLLTLNRTKVDLTKYIEEHNFTFDRAFGEDATN